MKDAQGREFQVSKGAPLVIFDLAKLADADRQNAQKIVDDLAAKGLRTLGVARADQPDAWSLLGILPIYDPPRPDS